MLRPLGYCVDASAASRLNRTWVLPKTCTHRNAATPLVLQVFNSDALFADGSQLADFKQVCRCVQQWSERCRTVPHAVVGSR